MPSGLSVPDYWFGFYFPKNYFVPPLRRIGVVFDEFDGMRFNIVPLEHLYKEPSGQELAVIGDAQP